jgi:hypothetical protein
MFGHTHNDLFKVVQSISETKDVEQPPSAVLTVCGSITTWGSLNPSYCEFEVDKKTLLPIKRKTYFFDITEANKTGEIKWQLATDWTSDYQPYGLTDLSPSSYQRFAEKMSKDADVSLIYLQHAARNTGHIDSCDEQC